MSALVAATAPRAALVLVVDDISDNRDLLELILDRNGFRSETAATGEEALDCVACRAPDLILLDLMLPGMDGIEVLVALKGSLLTRAIPILIISATSSRADRTRAMEAGAEDVLAKPLRHLELCARVRLALTPRPVAVAPHALDAVSAVFAVAVGDQGGTLQRFP